MARPSSSFQNNLRQTITKWVAPQYTGNTDYWSVAQDVYKRQGLAAPQVGVLRRAVIIIDDEGGYIEMVNPVITQAEGSQDGPEGCLSVPGRYGMVERPQQVTVEFQDRYGEKKTLHLEDFLARAACHEVDHLDGKLYLRLVSRFLTPEELE